MRRVVERRSGPMGKAKAILPRGRRGSALTARSMIPDWTQNTEDYSFKKKAEPGKGNKEANAMDEVLVQVKIQEKMIEELE